VNTNVEREFKQRISAKKTSIAPHTPGKLSVSLNALARRMTKGEFKAVSSVIEKDP